MPPKTPKQQSMEEEDRVVREVLGGFGSDVETSDVEPDTRPITISQSWKRRARFNNSEPSPGMIAANVKRRRMMSWTSQIEHTLYMAENYPRLLLAVRLEERQLWQHR